MKRVVHHKADIFPLQFASPSPVSSIPSSVFASIISVTIKLVSHPESVIFTQTFFSFLSFYTFPDDCLHFLLPSASTICPPHALTLTVLQCLNGEGEVSCGMYSIKEYVTGLISSGNPVYGTLLIHVASECKIRRGVGIMTHR